MIGLLWLLVLLALVVYAALSLRASERRYAEHERLRQEWLADPTDQLKYQRWLRSGRAS